MKVNLTSKEFIEMFELLCKSSNTMISSHINNIQFKMKKQLLDIIEDFNFDKWSMTINEKINNINSGSKE